MSKYVTTVTTRAAFVADFEYVTDEPTWWEIDSKGNLDILIGDMEPVATHLAGTYIAVSRMPYVDDE